MKTEDFGLLLFWSTLGLLALGSAVNGFVTGEIVTIGGEGRYDTEIIRVTLESDPDRFWTIFFMNLIVSVISGYFGSRIARGKD